MSELIPIAWDLALQVLTLGGFVPLYSRLSQSASKEDVLQSHTRRVIYRTIQSSPGMCLGDILEHLGLGAGTLYHHLSVLSKKGMIRTIQVGRRRHVYPIGAFPKEGDPSGMIQSMLRGTTAHEIALAIVRNPHSNIADLCTETGESQRVVYYHTKRFRDMGLVTAGPGKRYENIVACQSLVDYFVSGPSKPNAPVASQGDAHDPEPKEHLTSPTQ